MSKGNSRTDKIEGVKTLYVFVFQVRYSPCFVHTDKYTSYKDKHKFWFIVKFSFISSSFVLIPRFYHLQSNAP